MNTLREYLGRSWISFSNRLFSDFVVDWRKTLAEASGHGVKAKPMWAISDRLFQASLLRISEVPLGPSPSSFINHHPWQ